MKLRAIIVAVLLACICIPAKADIKIEKIKYEQYGQCYSISNGTVRVIVTADIGPRIICYQKIGGPNVLAQLDPALSNRNEKDFNIYGGHRLWHAPERLGRNNLPDNKPVKVDYIGRNALRFTQDTEQQSGIQKQILVKLDKAGTGVEIVHTLTNRGIWEVELAAWGLSVVDPGGVALIPNEPFQPQSVNLLPVRKTILWGYTDLSDSRWTFGSHFTMLKCSADKASAQKIGVENRQGWIGYLHNSLLFIKRFAYRHEKTYTDRGSNCEVYTAGNFMEIESLGTFDRLDTGQSTSHTERWYIFDNVPNYVSDGDLFNAITPLIRKTKQVK